MMASLSSMILFPAVLLGFQCIAAFPLLREYTERTLDLQPVYQDGPLVVNWTNLLDSMHLDDASPCTCSAKTCGCCQQIKIKELDIDTQACADVTFLSTQVGVKLTLSLGGKILFDKTVSIKNPDPICVKLGDNKFGAVLCVELYNIAVSLADLQGCARLQGKVFGKTVATVDLGCFKIPFKGSDVSYAVLKKEQTWPGGY